MPRSTNIIYYNGKMGIICKSNNRGQNKKLQCGQVVKWLKVTYS